MFHLLTAVTDPRAFPMRRRTPPGPAHDLVHATRSDSSPAAGTILTMPAESRPSRDVGTGPARAALWYTPILCCGRLSIALLLGFMGAENAGAQGVTPQSSRAAKIANAMTAGPEEIARNATVKDWPAKEGDGFAVLRQGTNGWVCVPDDPTTPGNDPTCMDGVFHDALEAYFAGQVPKVTRVGYAYMLTSDAEGSNTDPTAQRATPTNQWHHAGPHVMVLYPDAKLLEGLPTKPSAYGPYVMFPGTPIAHVMLPVASGYAHSASRGAHGMDGGKRP